MLSTTLNAIPASAPAAAAGNGDENPIAALAVMAKQLQELAAVHADMLAALRRCRAALAANGAPNCEAAKEAALAIAKAEGR